ncbi:hypothetical protein [Acutalibacter muris]|uniref:hypothetical protein n=1 Tax=Acutalibacter muris TaxID=1796620 RepID=UPI00272C11EE|nr:hypothetical protein [Acutalibacter muris]
MKRLALPDVVNRRVGAAQPTRLSPACFSTFGILVLLRQNIAIVSPHNISNHFGKAMKKSFSIRLAVSASLQIATNALPWRFGPVFA